MATNAFGIEIETVKAFLGYATGSPSDDSRDVLLELWLNAAIALAQSITGRSLERALYRDTLGYHPQHTYLRETPVGTVVSVSVGNSPLTADLDYQVFGSSGRLQFRNARPYALSGVQWASGFDYLIVDYVGGYTTLPSDILMGVLAGVQAAEAYNRQVNTSGGVVKQLTVVDVGSTVYATRPNQTSAAMQQAMNEHLADFLSAAPVLGAPMLHETERIGDAPESPTL